MTDAARAGSPLPMRRARGVVVGVVGGLLAVAGHAAGGGSVAGPLVPLVVAAVVAGCVVASSARWTPGRLVLALAGAQAAVHAALWLATRPSTPADPRLGALVAGGRLADHAAHTAHTAHTAHDGHGSGTGMLLAHVVATAAAVALLAALEALALSVAALLRRAAPRVPATVPALEQPQVVVATAAAPTASLLLRRAPRRGPPVAAAC